MLDDTCYFLGFDDLTDALIIWATLNSEHVQKLLSVLTFLDAKRPYTKELLMRIALNKVAEDLTFDQVRDLLKNLPQNISVQLTEDRWEKVLSKNKEESVEQEQYSLFESISN
jgi:hypothetical protein